jgi:hypothetical protein
MRLRNAFNCPRQYKTCLALKLKHGLVITRNIPVGCMRWLPSVKALVQNVGSGHAHECAEGRALEDNRIQITLTTAIQLGGFG